MARRPRKPPAGTRDDAVERERRERARRDRGRRRGAATKAVSERPARRAKPPRATPQAPAGGDAAVRARHEGLVGWVIRVVRGIPDGLVAVVRGFALEVVSVLGGSMRFIVTRIPGGRRVLELQRSARVSRGGDAGSVRRAPTGAGPRAEADARAIARRRALRRRRARTVLLVLLLASIVAAWVYVPASSVFRIRQVEVVGASSVGDLEIRERIDSQLDGETVFTVDRDEVVRRLEKLPFVRSATIERHLPGGLEVRIEEYRPLALGYGDGRFWLVARDGRILARARQEEWLGRVPKVTLRGDGLAPGVRVDDEPALRLLASRTSDSTLAFDVIKATRFEVTGRLVDGTEVRFGRPESLRQKVLVAEKVLREAVRADEQLLYIDVSVPSRPAFCARSQGLCLQPRGPREDAAAAASSDSGATTPEESGGDEATATAPSGAPNAGAQQ